MVTTRHTSWDEVTAALDRIEEHLRKRFTHIGHDAAAERANLEKSVRGAISLVEDFLGASAKTVHDPMLRTDLRHLAETMRKALLSTLEHAGELPDSLRRNLPGRAAPTAAHPARKAAARPTAKAKAQRTAHPTKSAAGH
jgi:hypothetical protein